MAEEEMTRAEAVAKRAMELAARAEELSRHAHEVAGVDEQLAALEAELEALAAEEARLDTGVEPPGPGLDQEGEDRLDPWSEWAETFSDRMEALGYRLGELVSGGLDVTMHPGPAECSAGRPVDGTPPVRISCHGGGVTVRAGAAGRVEARWRTRGWTGRTGADQAVKVQERDGTVLVETASRPGWRSKVSHIEVEVPEGSAVDITTGGGSVRVDGTRAPVRARTGGGSIRIDDVDGELSATTGGGSVRVRGRVRGESSIRTGGGSVEVGLAAGTRIDVEVLGTMASIDVAGLKMKGTRVAGTVGGGGDGRLQVSTGGGSARVREA